jgi:hypothetical protein
MKGAAIGVMFQSRWLRFIGTAAMTYVGARLLIPWIASFLNDAKHGPAFVRRYGLTIGFLDAWLYAHLVVSFAISLFAACLPWADRARWACLFAIFLATEKWTVS